MSDAALNPVAGCALQSGCGSPAKRPACMRKKIDGVRLHLEWAGRFMVPIPVRRNIRLFVLALICVFSFSAASVAEEHHWAYDGEFGPENWHKANPAYHLCKEGKNQSPVDLRWQYKVALPPLNLVGGKPATCMINTGHSIEVPFPTGNTLTHDGGVYALRQVHFHTPSENTLEGESFPMEAHFVHKNEFGRLLVLAVFFRDGPANPAIAALWNVMPKKAEESVTLPESFYAEALLPPTLDYMHFNGSLTTPPCSEGVRWCVLKKIMTVSKDQAEALRTVMHGPNNRPLQPINARSILY